MNRSRIAGVMAAAGAVTAIAGAPIAAADPEDLVPYCSGDSTPIDDHCRPPAYQYFTHALPGADPDIPLGPDPES